MAKTEYTPEEIAEFRAKELRIVRQAILKKLIEKLPLEDVCSVTKVTELSEKYVDYVYMERSTKGGDAGCVASTTKQSVTDWKQTAKGLNLAIPDSQNIKILNQVIDEYKKANKASANPLDVLTCCMQKFGSYPTKTGSVEKVVKQLLKG